MQEYEVELFKEQGFERKQCKKCKRFFWTLGERKTCGEPPCEEYSFIGDSPMKKKLNLGEMRETYLSFFEKNNHTRISRYPVIARWRDDVFFTQASIYCFQPWVTTGVVKPPANPLTISQPCLRFNDIDNVGKTGRHFTMFEMMAHHAFNTKENFVYFKDRTVELCHRFLTEDLGINKEDISYIEALWSGGGNSGPCFETLVGGVELATLVFMMYEGVGKGRKEMEMQVVDTGYGLERFVWLSLATPSAYEAVFGNVLEKLKKESRFECDEKILAEYSKVAGLMNVETAKDLDELRRRVAERLGITPKKLYHEIFPMENLYAICDHTKSLAFMLKDGIIPSNVKEGYFARLLIRRTLRMIDSLKLDLSISDIVEMQLDNIKKDFPEFREEKEDILKLVEVEKEKYTNTIKRGRGIVTRLEERIMKEGKDRIGLNSLVQLYDSQGLTPDIVKEFSTMSVEIPDDFYIKVAQHHETPKREKKAEIKIPEVPPTVLGYYEDSGIRKFNAKVVSRFDNYIVLDKTYFYPEGGGQEPDHGKIDNLRVLDVQKIGNVVVHKVDGDVAEIKENSTINCEIDWARRIQLMQHHTATHIINGAARKILGNHVWQSGAHKSVKSARLDLTHYERIRDEELERIEKLANRIVSENREIRVKFMERNSAEKEYGFRLYQGGVVPGGEIRVVNIKDWDVEACGGIHLNNTKDVELIKITGSKRIQDGVVRLEFVAGNAAKIHKEKIRKLTEKVGVLNEEELRKISAVFSVSTDQIQKTLKKFRDEWKQQKDELDRLEERIEEYGGVKYLLNKKYKKLPLGNSHQSAEQLFMEWKSQRKDIKRLRCELGELLKKDLIGKFRSEKLYGVRIVKRIITGMDIKTLSELAKDIAVENSLLILINVSGQKANVVVSSNSKFNANEIAKKLSSQLGGSASGDKNLGIGGGNSKNAEEILEKFEI